MVVDSTGVKVFGEGEGKVRQHGYPRRRTWRKIHGGVDEASGAIEAAVVTTNDYHESQLLPDLVDQVDEAIAQVSGDGAYDRRRCYAAMGGPARAGDTRESDWAPQPLDPGVGLLSPARGE